MDQWSPNQQPGVTESTLKRWMRRALAAAKDGIAVGENPFGAAIYHPSGEQIAVACNTVNSTDNASAHAEVNAIALACKSLRSSNLSGLWLLSTAEPCPMCMAAAANAGIRLIAFGAIQAAVKEAGYGDLGISGRQLIEHFNEKFQVVGSVLGNECLALLLANRRAD